MASAHAFFSFLGAIIQVPHQALALSPQCSSPEVAPLFAISRVSGKHSSIIDFDLHIKRMVAAC